MLAQCVCSSELCRERGGTAGPWASAAVTADPPKAASTGAPMLSPSAVLVHLHVTSRDQPFILRFVHDAQRPVVQRCLLPLGLA